jgi:uncharacterized membrane protein YqiK
VSSALYFEENISTFISLLPLIVVVLVIIFFFIKFYIISNTNQFVDSHSLWLTFYNNFENRGCRFASLYRNHSFTQLMFFVVNGGWKFIYPTFYASLCSA